MKMPFDKRIAFMISDQHFIPHGGIGSFAKTFYEMCESLNWRCDVILDKKPRDSVLLDWFKSKGAQIIHADTLLGYSDHQSKFVFSDSLNFEKVINFRNGLMKALETHLYDMILINTPEAGPAAYVMDLFQHIPVCFYTHNENIVFMGAKKSDVFNQAFDDISKSMMAWPNMSIGTQSAKNADSISAALRRPAHVLPMRVPERGLLEDNLPWDQKHGMLFIGRYEPRKNPEQFVEAAKRTGIKPLVLTNAGGKEKFERDFEAVGIKEYDIRVSIIGKEKVDFIKSARIAFHPSRLESYGFSAFESLHSCPTFALVEYDWYSAFDGMVHPLDKSVLYKSLQEAYDNPQPFYDGVLEKLRAWDSEIPQFWAKFVQESQYVNSEDARETKVVSLVKEGQTSLYDLYMKGLGRTKLAVDDVQSVLAKRHLFLVHQTEDQTYLSMEPFVEPQASVFSELFG